ncbi:MAG: cysteine desulfurase [Bacteroidales bacterium]
MDINHIRKDFKILEQTIHGKYPLVYLDNAATTQKPQEVIDVFSSYYTSINSNIHRGVHHLSQLATSAYEEARESVTKFLNATDSSEIIFTKGTTESINLVASGFEKAFIHKNDVVLSTIMEHHSNFVPWQEACKRNDAHFKVIPITSQGGIDLDQAEIMLKTKPKILAITHISNVLGTINPIENLIEIAHSYGVPVLIDGAQAVAHLKVDVQKLDCDFYCFSGHKVYAPMGIGVLYGKKQYLEALPPYQFGGEMISEVHVENTTYNQLPFKFEAGTPQVAEALALKAAINYINHIGIENIARHEHQLLLYASQKLQEIKNISIYGTTPNKAGVLSFNLQNIHPYDVGIILDQMGIAVRTGNHCAQPLMETLHVPGTVRASFAVYNTIEEIDQFILALQKAKKMLT